MLYTGTHFKYKEIDRLKIKKWRKLYHDNSNKKKVEVATLFSFFFFLGYNCFTMLG